MHRFLHLIVALFVTLIAPAAQGHEGTHAPDVLAVVNSATVMGQDVALSLTVTGAGGPLALTSLSAVGAQPIVFDPITVNFAQDVTVEAVLRFSAPPPASFTLTLDFGLVGQSTLNVVPKP
ncbi:MAG: hypothetical protein ABJR46_17305 [Tateyamaria sp.]|uniref:hypothetical protein n=1 Tax=Tateyamaria sp. TaxID=1929288 RepID=UPI00329BCEC6